MQVQVILMQRDDKCNERPAWLNSKLRVKNKSYKKWTLAVFAGASISGACREKTRQANECIQMQLARDNKGNTILQARPK